MTGSGRCLLHSANCWSFSATGRILQEWKPYLLLAPDCSDQCSFQLSDRTHKLLFRASRLAAADATAQAPPCNPGTRSFPTDCFTLIEKLTGRPGL
jgi:hypothetical protein